MASPLSPAKTISISQAPEVEKLPEELCFVMIDPVNRTWHRYPTAELLVAFKTLADVLQNQKDDLRWRQAYVQKVDQIKDQGDAHAQDQANPHRVTPEQVGLAQVADLAPGKVGPDSQGVALAADVHAYVENVLAKQSAPDAQPTTTRSDARDVYEARPTGLGLEFLLKLQPVDFYADPREAYANTQAQPVAPLPLRPAPLHPSTYMSIDAVGYERLLNAYIAAQVEWEKEEADYAQAYEAYRIALQRWRDANALSKLTADGSKASEQLQHGFIPQQVLEAMAAAGVDFGGVIDHLKRQGRDLYSMDQTQLIAPLTRAVQQIWGYLQSDIFIDRLADRMLQKTASVSTSST